jgi:hypothetical protein
MDRWTQWRERNLTVEERAMRQQKRLERAQIQARFQEDRRSGSIPPGDGGAGSI